MAPKQDDAHNKRVWAGDPRALNAVRENYRLDPEGQLVAFASALYSFKYIPRIKQELRTLSEELIDRAVSLQVINTRFVSNHDIDEADVISTLLEDLGRQKWLIPSIPRRCSAAAWAVCLWALNIATPNTQYPLHSRSLLTLTHARILLLKMGDVDGALANLESVSRWAPRIQDANQRTRVYRKLGLLYRKLGKFKPWLYWSLHACSVSGVSLAVRIKSVVALIGFEG